MMIYFICPPCVAKTPADVDAERAAQFSPFAAPGQAMAMRSRDCPVDRCMGRIGRGEKEEADQRLHRAEEEQLPVCITYYVPDERKAGGACYCGRNHQKLDEYAGTVKMAGGEAIPIHQIYVVEGEAFERET